VLCRIDDSDGIDLVATALQLAAAGPTTPAATAAATTVRESTKPGLEVATR
jgi:hypothetical protein